MATTPTRRNPRTGNGADWHVRQWEHDGDTYLWPDPASFDFFGTNDGQRGTEIVIEGEDGPFTYSSVETSHKSGKVIVQVWDGCQFRFFHAERVISSQRRESLMATRKAAKTASKQRTAKEGVCEYSGEATKGGKFRPGLDAALKGALLTAARDGDEKAAAELVVRGWPTKDIDKGVITKAKALVKSDPEGWLAKRVADRLRKVNAGSDPYTVVTGIELAA